MDRSKRLVSVAENGKAELTQCGEMRLFRFAGVKHVNLLAGVCQKGPFNLPELNETKTQGQRNTELELLLKSSPRANADNNPFSDVRDTRTVSINSEDTAHIFTILVVGHGVGFAPTAVITNPRTVATFVLQLFFIPEDRGPLMANLMARPNDVIESLVKELYPATR